MPVTSDHDSVETDEAVDDGIPVNELFYSLQGEGMLSGTPSVFIRTSGCNLRCWFCDSYHTSWEPQGEVKTPDEIIHEVKSYDAADHVVITGGEPMIHEEMNTVIEELSTDGYHITVETNGTIYQDAPIDLVSISPKLASSTPTPERDPKGDGEWEAKHEEQRVNIDSMAELIDNNDNYQLKFVVTGEEDMDEIVSMVEEIALSCETHITDQDVLLMPEGMTQEGISETNQKVARLAMEYGYRYTPRIHVNLWNDAPEK